MDLKMDLIIIVLFLGIGIVGASLIMVLMRMGRF
jgi:hypothetical protein